MFIHNKLNVGASAAEKILYGVKGSPISKALV